MKRLSYWLLAIAIVLPMMIGTLANGGWLLLLIAILCGLIAIGLNPNLLPDELKRD
ncbi:hypothetical protein [Deinococcus peraridilitoris]|uniref:Uncharacterized protein n=1 Tax=Deinococcus peraridilitoris (strain DSM 19664 / LMG 22246 / CIP 109416 / KR-200) TaxID=937777 RepID=K9ZZD4_DEIPD|nr:hypothetical protein [Deinococcus peraridilitoris]AFZ66095.1 hypothetical protein Deipe_0499 [Deinococcus peraridilitoris DSM 19664]